MAAMSRDYKDAGKRPSRGGNSFLVGILVGLLLGLSIALAVAWYINRLPTPFVNRSGALGKNDAVKGTADLARNDDSKAAPAKPRFDFYKILPGADEPATDQQFKDAQQKGPESHPTETFFLQAGAFQNAPDADNLKARLALLGLETT